MVFNKYLIQQLWVVLFVIVIGANGNAQECASISYNSIKILVTGEDSSIKYQVNFNGDLLDAYIGDEILFPDLKDGNYTFVISSDAYFTKNINILLRGKDITEHISLEPKKYDVVFVDNNGSTIFKEERVAYNENANPPEVPLRRGYEFIGWNKSLNNITANTIVKAEYRLTKSTKMEYASSVQVYPNPVKSFLNIDLNATSIDAPIDIVIVNASGKVVFHNKINQVKNRVDLSRLIPGVYHISVCGKSFKILKL